MAPATTDLVIQAARTFQFVLQAASEAGVLDYLQAEMSGPDVINHMCDGVAELAATKTRDEAATSLRSRFHPT